MFSSASGMGRSRDDEPRLARPALGVAADADGVAHFSGRVTKRTVDRTWPAFDPNAGKCYAVNNGEVFGAIRVNLAGREPKRARRARQRLRGASAAGSATIFSLW